MQGVNLPQLLCYTPSTLGPVLILPAQRDVDHNHAQLATYCTHDGPLGLLGRPLAPAYFLKVGHCFIFLRLLRRDFAFQFIGLLVQL